LDGDGAGAGSGDFGFSEVERRSTGGAPVSSTEVVDALAGFLAASAAISAADCHLPSPIHVSFPRKAAFTVNNPCETPAFTAS
jgi:hypothetical protein